jgi:hypothetical protein
MTAVPVNPANKPERRVTDGTRVPMTLPTQKLAVPEIPGYHLHWFLGGRVPRALQAGYEFVDEDEVDIPNTGLADDVSKSGNTDMGSRISRIAGDTLGEDGREQRLYLMKIRQEWWEHDQSLLAERNEQIAATIRGGNVSPDKAEGRYVPESARKTMQNLFSPKRRST